MNILMMSNTYKPILGGLEKSIQWFTAEYRKQGHTVVIAAPSYEGQPEREFGVIRIPAVQNFSGTDFSVNLPIPGLLSKITNSFHPDIVHAHHPFLMGDMALRLCGQYQIPLFYTYHILFDHYAHYLPLNEDAGRKFLVELSVGYSNLADCVIAPSQSVKEILREQGVKSPIEVVPTGISIKRFKAGDGKAFRKKVKLSEKDFVVGHIGRLAEEKNLSFLARAVAIFLKREPKAKFLLIGSGPSKNEVLGILQKEGVREQCIAPGAIQGKGLMDAYHAMDVFAFSSISETQGMVLAEAMAAGVPVVALDAPGAREVVRDRKNGRLLKKGTEASFAAALNWCYFQKAADWKKIKKKAVETAEDFSLESCATRMLKIYQRVKRRKEFEGRDISQWTMLMNRIRTEWEMIGNLGKAAGAAMVEPFAKALEDAGDEKQPAS